MKFDTEMRPIEVLESDTQDFSQYFIGRTYGYERLRSLLLGFIDNDPEKAEVSKYFWGTIIGTHRNFVGESAGKVFLKWPGISYIRESGENSQGLSFSVSNNAFFGGYGRIQTLSLLNQQFDVTPGGRIGFKQSQDSWKYSLSGVDFMMSVRGRDDNPLRELEVHFNADPDFVDDMNALVRTYHKVKRGVEKHLVVK